MNSFNAQPVVDTALHCLNACRLEGGAGRYKAVVTGDGGPDLQASAAAVNLLYMMDILPGRNHERQEWVEYLQSGQDPETGLYPAGAEGSLPLTAACAAALYCFDCAPPHPPTDLMAFAESGALPDFFSGLEWCAEPEKSARKLGALFTILVLGGQVGPEWEERFFRWIDTEADEHTGLLRKQCLAPVELDGHWTLLPYLNAHLYPLAACQYARHPHPLPWRLVDTALEVMEFHRELFFQRKGHRHLPWVMILSRSLRRTAHRHEEAMQQLQRFLPAYLDYLRDQTRSESHTRLVRLQWDLSTLAELQMVLPGQLKTRRPLRQILDRHPFL